MATQSVVLNRKMVESRMNRLGLVDDSMVGKKYMFTVRGNGTVIDVKNKAGEYVQSVVEPGTVFQTRIFNLDAKSAIALKNPANHALAATGLAAERAGNYAEAHEKYQDFLNAVRLSFNIPTTSRIVDRLGDQVDIEARVIKITTENGSLLTIDPTTIRVIEPEVLPTSTWSFDVLEPKTEEPKSEKSAEKLLKTA
jgi:hypothetical protein